MRIILLLIAVMLLIAGAEARYSPGLEIASGENITFDGGYIHDLGNASEDQDAVTFSQSSEKTQASMAADVVISDILGVTTAIRGWEVVAYGINSSDVINSALAEYDSIYIKDNLTFSGYVDIPRSGISISGDKSKTITASEIMPSMFLIDPAGKEKNFTEIEFRGLRLNCNDKAEDGIRITGNSSNYTSAYIYANDLIILNSTVAGIRLNSTSLSVFNDIFSYGNDYGILLEESCVNVRITDSISMIDTIGYRIGDEYPAYHAMCEGISIEGCHIIGSEEGVWIKHAHSVHIVDCMIDQCSHAAILSNGDIHKLDIGDCYLSNNLATGYVGTIEISGDAHEVIIHDSHVGYSSYYGIAVFNDGSGGTRGIFSIHDLVFYPSARVIASGGDILYSESNNVIISGNHFVTNSGGANNLGLITVSNAVVQGNIFNGAIYTSAVSNPIIRDNIGQ